MLAHRKQHDQAAHLAPRGHEARKRTDWWQFTGEVALDAALVLEAVGHRDEARAAAQQAASLFERKGNLVSAGHAQTLMAHLASPQPA